MQTSTKAEKNCAVNESEEIQTSAAHSRRTLPLHISFCTLNSRPRHPPPEEKHIELVVGPINNSSDPINFSCATPSSIILMQYFQFVLSGWINGWHTKRQPRIACWMKLRQNTCPPRWAAAATEMIGTETISDMVIKRQHNMVTESKTVTMLCVCEGWHYLTESAIWITFRWVKLVVHNPHSPIGTIGLWYYHYYYHYVFYIGLTRKNGSHGITGTVSSFLGFSSSLSLWLAPCADQPTTTTTVRLWDYLRSVYPVMRFQWNVNCIEFSFPHNHLIQSGFQRTCVLCIQVPPAQHIRENYNFTAVRVFWLSPRAQLIASRNKSPWVVSYLTLNFTN